MQIKVAKYVKEDIKPNLTLLNMPRSHNTAD